LLWGEEVKLNATAKSLLGLAVLVMLYFAVVCFDRSTTNPGAQGQSIDDFLKAKRAPQKVERIEKEGQSYLFVTGRMSPLWIVTVPSGPPCYVFNASGRLVDWTSDVGDAPYFQEKWPSSLKRQELNGERLREVVQSQFPIRATRETAP
jgi:hypothetical protein